MPKVSVVMPVHNGERHISTAIESVLAQTEQDLELIVVDDGSTDETVRVVIAFMAHDSRIRLLERSHSGSAAVPRTDGIAMSTGQYLCFLDHDDVYAVDRVRQLIEILERYRDWSLIFHDVNIIDELGRSFPHSYLRGFLDAAAEFLVPLGNGLFRCRESFFRFQALRYAALHTISIMIDLNRINRANLFFHPEFIVSSDTDLWLRLGTCERFGYLDKCLSSYRLHETNITRDSMKMNRYGAKVHSAHYARIYDRLSPKDSAAYRRKIARFYFDLGYSCSVAKDLSGAMRSYAESWRWARGRRAALGFAKATLRSLRPWRIPPVKRTRP